MFTAQMTSLEFNSGTTALGFVRTELSAQHTSRHSYEIQRHARAAGYRYLGTFRPPAEEPNPLTAIRARATELGARVIIAFDLGQVNNQPSLFCDLGYQLETVSPQMIWTPSVPYTGSEPTPI